MRKGTHHSEAAKAKLRSARELQTPWNKGIHTGPRPVGVRQKISDTAKGQAHLVSPEKQDAWRQAISESKKGQVQSDETRQRRSASMRRAYAEGRKTVKPSSGYGKGAYYDSPFQGRIWLRSGAEIQRARELDAEGSVWFYEVQRYNVLMDRVTSYTPDFWIVPGVSRDSVLGEAKVFLQSLSPSVVWVEDVKGWWKPTHKTFPKIQAFREQYPEIQFDIVIREGRL